MKVILGSYILGFIVLFIFSAIKGAISDIDASSPQVFRNISSATMSNLTFSCDNKISFSWNVDGNTLRVVDPDGTYILSFFSSFDPFRLEKTSDVFFAFIGGASASYELNDLREMLKGKGTWFRKLKRIFGTIAGALSGYTLGEWVGSYWLVDCKSKSVQNFVKNDANWPEIEKTIGALNLTMAISRCDRNIEDLEGAFPKHRVKSLSRIKSLELEISELESMSREQYFEGRTVPKGFSEKWDFEISYYSRTSSSESSLYNERKYQAMMRTSPTQFLSHLTNVKKLDFNESDFEYIEMLHNICKSTE